MNSTNEDGMYDVLTFPLKITICSLWCIVIILCSLMIASSSTLHRQRLLVIGGGGAVGFAAIQLSVAAGCHVTTTCGSQSIDRLLAAGAEQAVDYTAEVFF